MALTSARYSHGLLPPVPPPAIPNREPTPTKENSDNDGMSYVVIDSVNFQKQIVMDNQYSILNTISIVYNILFI